MKIRNKAVSVGKICLLLILLLVSLTLFGCYGIRSTPTGGSGGVVVDGTLYIGSMTGKLVAVNTSDGSSLWESPLETTTAGGGGFGCAPAAIPVAIYGSPAVGGNLIYVGDYSGKIYEFDSSTHLSTNRYVNETNPQPIIGAPVVAGNRVYLGCADGKVYALDATSLDLVWEKLLDKTGDKIWSTPVIDGDTLYIGSFDKKLYAINVSDGSPKWEFDKAEGAIASTPLVYNNTIYVGSFDRYFYAVDAITGSLKWKSDFAAGKWFWTRAVACNNTIYAPCLDGKVYALDAETGAQVAEPFDLGSPVYSWPVLVNGKVIVATEEGKVYAIDTANNQKSELQNLAEAVYAPLCADDEVIYIYSQGQNLYALNAESGATLWRLSLK